MTCKECNTMNKKDANFCSNCGKSLVEKEEVKNVDVNKICKSLLENVKGILKKPIDTAKKYIKEENYMTSLLYLGLNIILLAIMFLAMLSPLVNSISDFVNSIYGWNYLGLNIGSMGDIPYFKIFMIVIISGVVIYGLFVGLIYLINTYLFKNKTNFKNLVTWVGYNSLFNSIAIIVMSICFLISFKLALIIYLITEVIYTFNMFRTLEFAINTNVNKIGYLLTISMIGTFLFVVVILPKLLF